MAKVQVSIRRELELSLLPEEAKQLKKLVSQFWRVGHITLSQPEGYDLLIPTRKFHPRGEEGPPVLRVLVSERDSSGRVLAVEVIDLHGWRVITERRPEMVKLAG